MGQGQQSPDLHCEPGLHVPIESIYVTTPSAWSQRCTQRGGRLRRVVFLARLALCEARRRVLSPDEIDEMYERQA